MGSEKPKCPIIGANGNIFNLLGIAIHTLKKAGLKVEAEEMSKRVYESKNYYEALSILGDYIDPVTQSEMDLDEEESMLLR